MARVKKSQRQRKERAVQRLRAQEEFGAVPHTFVFHRGRVGSGVRALSRDLRRCMEPYTARRLTVRKKNSLRDFVVVSGPLGVTHFFVFSKSDSSVNLRLFCLPGGPTLTFKVTEYSLVRDVVSAQRRHRMHEQQFSHPPLLVLSDFTAPHIHLRLTATAFQSALPAISVHKVNLNSIKRCLLLTYSADTELIHFRHYSVKVVPVGLSKGLRKLLQERFPNMNRMDDISDLLLQDVNLSESEAEHDGTHNVTELPQRCAGRGNMAQQQSAVRLTEIGPRMTLRLVKVEEGLAQGDVLYHSFVRKTEAEVRALRERRDAKLRLKEERRRLQESAVLRKRRLRELHRAKSLEGMRRERRSAEEESQSDSDSDAEHFRREVGREPEPDLFPKRTRSPSGSEPPQKRRRRTPNPRPMGQEGQRRTPNPRPMGQGAQRRTPNPRPMGQKKRPTAPGKKRGTPNPHPTAPGKKRGTPNPRPTSVGKQQGTPKPPAMGQGHRAPRGPAMGQGKGHRAPRGPAMGQRRRVLGVRSGSTVGQRRMGAKGKSKRKQ